jgi:sugar O-acyltransferase (sialic acid O-acetyltransferase NeuD family)
MANEIQRTDRANLHVLRTALASLRGPAMENRPIAILGAGGYAREVLWLIRECNDSKPSGFVPAVFIDDLNPSLWGTERCGIQIRGWDWFEEETRRLAPGATVAAILGVGPPKAKAILHKKASRFPIEYVTFVHPSVRYAHGFVTFGKGCSITAGCILTTQVTVGDHVSLNLDCTVGHDTVIRSFCNVSPGTHISGNVTLGIGADLGTGASILNNVSIGDFAVIGAQAAVIADIPRCATVVGVPAKLIKQNPEPEEFRGLS